MVRVVVNMYSAGRGGEHLTEKCVEHVGFGKGILYKGLSLFQVRDACVVCAFAFYIGP